MRGFHVYQTVWFSIIGEEDLKCRHDKQNEEDKFAIAVYRYDFPRETVIGHISRSTSKFVYRFLQFPDLKPN